MARLPRPSLRHLSFPTLLVGLVLFWGGCGSSLSDIDRRIDRVLGETSTSMRGSKPPSRPSQDSALLRRPDMRRTDLPTTNLPAGELNYQVADEARDVASRLEAYSRRFTAADDPNAVVFDLFEAWQQAQLTGREYRSAEEDLIVASIRLLVERHLWGPRFFNDTSANLSGSGFRGDFDHALQIVNTLRATQRLPYGGSLEAQWITRATEQLRSRVSDRYVQSSVLALDASIPLLRGAGAVAREDIIQAERDLIYAAREFERFRRRHLVDLARDYFALRTAADRIRNQEESLRGLERLDEGERARVEAGRRAAFQRRITENQVLSARSALAGQRESYILALQRFKIRLGLDPDVPLVIDATGLELPEPDMDLDEAAALALEYRLDLQNQRDRLSDARRAVANARNALLPGLNFGASVRVPTDPTVSEGNFNFNPDYTQYSAGITFSMPLDRETERLRLKQTQLALAARERDLDRARDDAVVTVRAALRRIDLARNQLELAERQVEINRLRLEEQELKADEVEPQRIVDTRTELLRAQNERDQAKADLQIAVLNFLLETDMLRVTADGTIQHLPGMESRPSAPDPGGEPSPPAMMNAPELQPIDSQ